MNRNVNQLVKSGILLVVMVAILAAGFFLIAEDSKPAFPEITTEASLQEQNVTSEKLDSEVGKNSAEDDSEASLFNASKSDEDTLLDEKNRDKKEAVAEEEIKSSVESDSSSAESDQNVATHSSSGASGDDLESDDSGQENLTASAMSYRTALEAEEDSKLSQTESEKPVKEEVKAEAPTVEVVEKIEAPQAAPVSFSWGASRNYTFRTEVLVTNNGGDTSRNVQVSVPLIESNSPYQTTTLKSVNYSPVSSSGRVSTFNIGDLAPGETKSIVADFTVTLRTVSLNSSNETVEKARAAYEQYAGSANCRTLARGFISKCSEMGVKAREVVGYARPQHGAMTSGSLQGTRHSWAEFYVDGLGWVPVDLTFHYFGSMPHTSHIIEGYSDQSIRVNFSGGSISASWSNSVL